MMNAGSYSIHVSIRVKGAWEKVMLMHHLLKKVDGDWPFVERQVCRVCKRCCGVEYQAPRLTAHDVKVAGKQCGVKVKIRHFGPVQECQKEMTAYDFSHEMQAVVLSEAQKLTTATGLDEFRDKYLRQVGKVELMTPVVVPAGSTELIVLPGKEEKDTEKKLMEAVLSGEVDDEGWAEGWVQ